MTSINKPPELTDTNFPQGDVPQPKGMNPKGPAIGEQTHEPPPRMPTEHRQESPHHNPRKQSK